jgi:hypothetical protein
MIATRDRPVEDVQNALANLEENVVPEVTVLDPRRGTARDGVFPIPQTTIADVVRGDYGSDRKKRLLQTLDGSPNKGTVVVAIRGTEDITDFALDLAVFTDSKRNQLRSSREYEEIKNHIETTLTTYFTTDPSIRRNYSRKWDVFATGHSLGGAITDQLILDGVVKGGVTFSAPRTISSKLTQPSYGIINAQDGVIGTAFGQRDSPYDLIVPGVPLMKASYIKQHNMAPYLEPSKTASRIDRYPRYNGKLFKPGKKGQEYNKKMESNEISFHPNIDEVRLDMRVSPVAEELEGSGRAPQLHTMYEAAKNAYDNGAIDFKQSTEDFLQQGLLLPQLTLRRYNKAIVMFYVFSTPPTGYFEMPVRILIENAVRDVIRDMDVEDAKVVMLLNNF